MATRFNLLDRTNPPIERLRISGRHFVDPLGNPMRFWGVNTVAFYPDRDTARAYARNLASLGVNLVRLHHLMRPSLDWNWTTGVAALSSYADDKSRCEPTGRDAVAWDRLDDLVAELARNGIYVMLSAHFSRTFRQNDVSIKTTTQADADAWKAAMAGLTAWDATEWWDVMDKWKMLPVIDERCALLQEELLTQLLGRVNPHLGVTYAANPQVLGLEILNEYSSFYVIVNGNRFENPNYPAISYFHNALIAKWNAHLAANGISPTFDLYSPQNDAQQEQRRAFLNGLDQTHRARIAAKAAALGAECPITFSNLWRAESDTKLASLQDPYTEDHAYLSPDVTKPLPYTSYWNGTEPAEDFIYPLALGQSLGTMPQIVGELNFDISSQAAEGRGQRPMMQFAVGAYGTLQDWSGVAWFAWNHGDHAIATNGWGASESTAPSDDDLGGNLVNDQVRIDHFRTAAALFRNGLLAPSTAPQTVMIDDPVWNSFGWPPNPKYKFKPGWQNRSRITKCYGTKPTGQDTSPLMTQALANPIVSDTDQICKDMIRRQLTVSAPKAEVFSGLLDGSAPALLDVIATDTVSGFATVAVVSADDLDLSASTRLVVSRSLQVGGTWSMGPGLRLKTLKAPSGVNAWYFRATRPRSTEAARWWRPTTWTNGELVLPVSDNWTECELYWGPFPNEILPTTPTDLVAVVRGKDRIELSWKDTGVSEVGYIIERAASPGTSFGRIAVVPPNTFSFTDPALTADTSYWYRVRAANWSGTSSYSNVVTGHTDLAVSYGTRPVTPTSPVVTVTGSTTLTLSWTDASSDETVFIIERAIGAGSFTTRAMVDAGTTSIGDWGLTPSTTYRYRIYAANLAGLSTVSAIAQGTTTA